MSAPKKLSLMGRLRLLFSGDVQSGASGVAKQGGPSNSSTESSTPLLPLFFRYWPR